MEAGAEVQHGDQTLKLSGMSGISSTNREPTTEREQPSPSVDPWTTPLQNWGDLEYSGSWNCGCLTYIINFPH